MATDDRDVRRFKLYVSGLVVLLLGCGLLAGVLHDPLPVEAARRYERVLRRDDLPLADVRTIALDVRLPVGERLGALRYLRGRKNADDSDARTDDVVLGFIDAFEQASDPELRADILRQLSGLRTTALRAPLIAALASDPSELVRSEAAETLAGFLTSQEVVDALEQAAASDVSIHVRSQANRTLLER